MDFTFLLKALVLISAPCLTVYQILLSLVTSEIMNHRIYAVRSADLWTFSGLSPLLKAGVG